MNFKTVAIGLFLLCVSVYVLISPGHLTTSMDRTAYYTATNFVNTGTWGFSERITHEVAQGKDGKFYSYEGLFVMLSPVPLVLISQALGVAAGKLAFLTNGIITAFVSLLLLLVAREMGYSIRTSLLLALVYGFGTQAFVHTKFLMPDPLASCVFLAIFLFFLKYNKYGQRKWLVWTGALCGAAANVRPDSFIFVGAVIVGIVFTFKDTYFKKKREYKKLFSDLLAFGLPIVLFLSIFAVYNYSRFGSIMETGYTKIAEERGLATSKLLGDFRIGKLLSGLAGMWIIPNRSMFFINPVLLMSLFSLRSFYRKYKRPALIIGIALVMYALLYANRGPYGFAGSAAWGQRYLLPMTAFLVLPMGIFLEKSFSSQKKNFIILFIGVLLLSLVIQFIGASQSYQNFQAPLEKQFGPDKARIMLTMDPRYSLLLLNWKLLQRGHTDFMYYNYLYRGNVPVWAMVTFIMCCITVLLSCYLLWKPLQVTLKEQVSEKRRKRGQKRRKMK